MKTLFCYHVATLPRFKEITNDIILSGIELLHNCDKIMIGVNDIGNSMDIVANQFSKYCGFEIYNNYSNNWEFVTLKRMYDFICDSNDNWKVCYCHSTGVNWTKNHGDINECLEDRRHYLNYFNLVKYKDCINALDEYDICGVDWSEIPEKHFSGNYWWATSNYIKSLKDPYDVNFKFSSRRHKNEFWIGSNNPHYKCFNQSEIPINKKHLIRYQKEKYIS